MKRNPAETSAAFSAILTEQLGTDPAKITPQAILASDLGADSLDLVEIAMAVEVDFGFDIADEDAERLHTVQDWLTFIDATA